MGLRRRSKQHGFTLIEVMVALLVVGIALPALMFQLGAQLDATDRFRQQTLAGWVAKNQMSQLQLDAAAGLLSTTVYREGESELAGRRWTWQVTVEQTPVPGLLRHRVDVAAMDRPADTLASLSSYLSAAQIAVPVSTGRGAGATD